MNEHVPQRLLIVPAAGLGTRLGASVAKALVPVNGRPMLDYLRALYAPYVAETVVIAHPSFAGEIRRWADAAGRTSVTIDPSSKKAAGSNANTRRLP